MRPALREAIMPSVVLVGNIAKDARHLTKIKIDSLNDEQAPALATGG